MNAASLRTREQSVQKWGELLERIKRITKVILECETGDDFARCLAAIGADVEGEHARPDLHRQHVLTGYREVCSTLRDAMRACAADRSRRELLVVFAIAHEGIQLLDPFPFVTPRLRLEKTAFKNARACFREIRQRWIETVSTVRADLLLDAQEMVDLATAIRAVLYPSESRPRFRTIGSL